jgi:UPF0755 protein
MGRRRKKDKGLRKAWKITLSLLGLGILVAIFLFYNLFQKVYAPNISGDLTDQAYLYIPTGATLEDVKSILEAKGLIKDIKTFEWVVSKMNYRNHVNPGKYKLKPGMNNRELVQMLRAGDQEPVNLKIRAMKRPEMVASYMSQHLEADSAMLMAILTDKNFLRQYNLTPQNSQCIFIPNTYEFYWNTDARDFFNRMILEFDGFWTDKRRGKAKSLGLSATEIMTLASIVQKETPFKSEKNRVAGVYLNRLRKNWRLQADPTLVYLMEDMDNPDVAAFRKKHENNPKRKIKRVLNIHKEFDSPYNTYIYEGLPPGPIAMAEIESIDAVLNAETHNYMFFCAKPDLSGHNFAVTYKDHQVNVKRYRAGRNRAGDGS